MALDRLSQVTSSGISSTVNFRATGITVSGIVTANSFVGDGSGLTGVVGSGSGVVIKDDNATVGTASTINFGSNLSVSAISSGIVTVTGTDTNTTYTQASVADGSNVNLRLSGSDSTTDDILLTAGSNISFSGVGAGGFTINSSAGGGGSSQFVTTSAGIHTLSNVGIGTTNPISALTVTGNTLVTGVVTATSFSGSGSGLTNIPAGQLTGTLPAIDGSSLTGIVGSGSGIIVKDSGSTVGTAGTIDFGDNLTVSAISAGIVTVTGSAGGGSSQFVTTSTGIHTLSNVGIGTTNPTKKLTVSGDALINGLTVGVGTGTITGNTVLGLNAFFSNTTGIDNTAVGAGVLYLNLTGSDNTAIGRGSQYSNNGNYNTSTGSLALYGLVSGQYNVAIGYESARESYIATGNVAIGGLALRTNYTGLNNVAIGYYAGYGVTTSNNVIIGPAPSGAVPNVTYQPPIPNGDTQLVIGARNTAWIHGNSSYNIGIGTTNPTSKLTVSGDIKVTGVVTATTFVGALTGTASNVTTNANLTGDVTSTGNATSIAAGVIVDADINASAAISLSKLSTSGTLTATTFVGALTGNASSATIATYTSEWILGANGSADYTFTGSGLIGAENDPVLYLVRGQQYKFTNTMGAHPFRIQSTVNGSTGTQYNDGITNNDVSNGTLTWNVQFDAPNILYYQCTAHGSMGGKIYIIDAGVGPDISINTTGIITATSVVVSSGSTSAPAITPSGDSNTGIFFPSADTIAFGEGGVEAARFDSSGRFGLGTANPTTKLEIVGSYSSGAITTSFKISGSGWSLGGGPSLEFGHDPASYPTWVTGRIASTYSGGNWGGGLKFFYNNGTTAATLTEGMELTRDGNLAFPSGKGIDFSATANSSGTMTSELLSDYEEGTWTPVDADGDAYTTNKLSTYTRVGRLVWAMCDVSATSTANGSKIGGLPFTSFGQSGTSFAGNYPCFNGYTSGPDARMNGHINSQTTQITLFVGGTETSLTNGQRIIITALYLA